MAGKRTSLKNMLMVGILGAGFITVLALTLASLFLISEAHRNSLHDLEQELRSSFDRLIRFQTETAYTMLEELAYETATSLLR